MASATLSEFMTTWLFFAYLMDTSTYLGQVGTPTMAMLIDVIPGDARLSHRTSYPNILKRYFLAQFL
jgi:hypothetical protein